MAAFRYSVDVLKTDCLELDAHLTKDRIPVVCHDKNLKRLTGIDVDVSQLNYCELPKLKNRLEVASQPDGTSFWEATQPDIHNKNKMNNNMNCNGVLKRLEVASDLSIPKLEDVFSSFPNTLLNLDVKSGSKELMDLVADLVIKYKREKNIVWGSEELPENCDYLYKKNPDICIFFNYPDVLRALFLFWTGLMPFFTFRPTHLQVPFPLTCCFPKTHRSDQASWYTWIRYKVFNFLLMQKTYFEHLEARGIPTGGWTINSEKHFDEALDIGINGILTDYPTKLKIYIEKRNNNITDITQ